MGLLRSIENINGIEFNEYRDIPYYNKYIYKATYNIIGARYVWYSTSFQGFKEKVTTKKYWGMSAETKEIIIDNFELYEKLFKWKPTIKKIRKDIATIRIQNDTLGIYSNDLNLLKTVACNVPEINFSITEAKLTNFVGVKYFIREPKHKFRVYLRSKRVNSAIVESLCQVIENNKEVYPCPALRFWVGNMNMKHWKFRWLNGSHFIDYDEESQLSYLSIILDDILGRQFKLEKRPEQEII